MTTTVGGAAPVRLPPALGNLICCPSCGGLLGDELQCLVCRASFRATSGIPDLLPATERSEVEAFVTEYNAIRKAQGWDVEDVNNLPYGGGASPGYWKLRRRSFELIQRVCRRAAVEPLVALDLGAGFGWLTRCLAEWGYQAIAVDVNLVAPLGLLGAGPYLAAGACFERVRASLDHLPFRDGTADLIVLNASLTYAKDHAGVLRRIASVCRDGGILVIADTPIYRTRRGGESMSRRLYAQHRRTLGRAPIYHARFTYLHERDLYRYLEAAGFEYQVEEPPQDLWWRWYLFRNRLMLREPVWMPVIIARKGAQRRNT